MLPSLHRATSGKIRLETPNFSREIVILLSITGPSKPGKIKVILVLSEKQRIFLVRLPILKTMFLSILLS